ncbi:hypothetical protein BaRGS_00017856 [Batillaria attramentaria]|uniref:Uncharacterized protein n=1 Tax=Batillaria attramentaria TaxID=370345 RepID=A0ABD0KV16_9CAEN
MVQLDTPSTDTGTCHLQHGNGHDYVDKIMTYPDNAMTYLDDTMTFLRIRRRKPSKSQNNLLTWKLGKKSSAGRCLQCNIDLPSIPSITLSFPTDEPTQRVACLMPVPFPTPTAQLGTCGHTVLCRLRLCFVMWNVRIGRQARLASQSSTFPSFCPVLLPRPWSQAGVDAYPSCIVWDCERK